MLIIYQSQIIITYNSFKYFIGYNDNNVIKTLYLELSQMTGYINKFNERKNKNKNKNKNRIRDKNIKNVLRDKNIKNINIKNFLKITIKYAKN